MNCRKDVFRKVLEIENILMNSRIIEGFSFFANLKIIPEFEKSLTDLESS